MHASQAAHAITARTTAEMAAENGGEHKIMQILTKVSYNTFKKGEEYWIFSSI